MSALPIIAFLVLWLVLVVALYTAFFPAWTQRLLDDAETGEPETADDER